jgi:hypothetical protein
VVWRPLSHGTRLGEAASTRHRSRQPKSLWRNIRITDCDAPGEADRVHVVLSQIRDCGSGLCLALGPTTAGPSNISQARTMAWPSTEIDLSSDFPLTQKHSYFSLINRSLQPYTQQLSPNSRYSNAYLITFQPPNFLTHDTF